MVIIIGYVIYYGYLVISDIFLKKESVGLEKINEEEEVDISGESANFRPEMVSKSASSRRENNNESRQLIVNTGAISIDDFLPMAEDFAENGTDNAYGKLCALWGASF